MTKTVPDLFRHSLTIPIPKSSDNISRVAKSSDFRGIAVSCVFAQIYEKFLLVLYWDLFKKDDSQFGFKRGSAYTSAIFSAIG